MPQQQELPTRLPLVVQPENRDATTSKDAKLINGYVEKVGENKWRVFKRPGYLVNNAVSTAAGAGHGIFNWNGDIYAVAGGFLYKNGAALGAVSNTGASYSFDSILGATPKLVLGNGTNAYAYDSGGGLVPMAGVSPPASFLPGWAFVDATLYYVKLPTAVYGSGINDVTSGAAWDPLNLINAWTEPDPAIAIAKQLVYVIVFKQWTTEVFYDAGNATGSPLGPVQGGLITYGCESAASIKDIDGKLFWLGSTRNGSAEILMLDQLKYTVISTKPIEKLLRNSTFATIYSWSYKGDGHKFYVLTLVDINLTLAFDIAEGTWQQWTDTNGNYMPICSSTFLGRTCLLQHITNGKIYTMSNNYTNDDGTAIVWDLYTPNFDAGIDRRKILDLLRINADETPGSVLQIRSNDHDYKADKWSNFVRLDLNQERPFLTDQGTFYKRAYHFRHQCDTSLRISSIDISMQLGEL